MSCDDIAVEWGFEQVGSAVVDGPDGSARARPGGGSRARQVAGWGRKAQEGRGRRGGWQVRHTVTASLDLLCWIGRSVRSECVGGRYEESDGLMRGRRVVSCGGGGETPRWKVEQVDVAGGRGRNHSSH